MTILADRRPQSVVAEVRAAMPTAAVPSSRKLGQAEQKVLATLRQVLNPGLIALSQEKPDDPRTFLANYLLTHKPPPELEAEGARAAREDGLIAFARDNAHLLDLVPDGMFPTESRPFSESDFKPMDNAIESVRVLQWNILADGLSDDAFLVKDVFDPPMKDFSFEEMARVVIETRQKKGDMSVLQSRLDNPRSISSHAIIVDWTRRLRSMLAYIEHAKPHIITMQELDHMAEMQSRLAALGYACGYDGKIYEPAHEWAGALPKV